jgi:hypothetical protein
MRKESLPLIQTNPYLQDSKERESRLTRSVLSSSAIEGVHIAACRALGIKGKVKKAKVVRAISKSSQSHL